MISGSKGHTFHVYMKKYVFRIAKECEAIRRYYWNH